MLFIMHSLAIGALPLCTAWCGSQVKNLFLCSFLRLFYFFYIYRHGIIYARANCFRNRKSGQPHKVLLAFQVDSGKVADAACECPAGASGTCTHVPAALRLTILLQKKGFKEAPPELSCTDLPQQWGRPRRQGLRPIGLQDVDWRSPRKDGVPVPVPVWLFGARVER